MWITPSKTPRMVNLGTNASDHVNLGTNASDHVNLGTNASDHAPVPAPGMDDALREKPRGVLR